MGWRDTKERLTRARSSLFFHGSGSYWERRYKRGDTSGAGSYGAQAEYKARFLNSFVRSQNIQTIIEFGCGDGNQLKLAEYPLYLGLDVSRTAVQTCLDTFRGDHTKSFLWYEPEAFRDDARYLHAQLALSLDVVYHLVEDDVYETYMRNLFRAGDRYVVVYGTDEERRVAARHVRHRPFTRWVTDHAPEWALQHVDPPPEESYQSFYFFERGV
jgi:hypothetical protein